MSKYIPTNHSKIRFYERVDKNYNHRDETIRLAKKYGLKLDDIPKRYKYERNFLGRDKIYYNDMIYIFAKNSNYNVLITIYNNTSKVLKKLFDAKEAKRKEEKKARKQPKIENKTIYVSAMGRVFELLLINGKVAKIEKKTDKKEYPITKHPITKRIEKIYCGEFVDCEEFLNIDVLSPKDKAIYYEVLRIPHGKSITFKTLKERLNNMYSYPTIITSLVNCPFKFLIPSHRVIREDGTIGSYCCKPRFKKRLLRREHIKYKNTAEA